MKRISTFLSLLFIGGFAFGQSPLKKDGVAFSPKAAEKTSGTEVTNVIPNKATKAAAGPGDVIYYFDFNSGVPTGWTLTGTPSSALWEYRGPSTTPSNGVGSQGAYNGTRGPIASSSAGNGFMIFDSDYLDNGGTPGAFGTGPAAAPHSGEMITGVLDFSATPNVTLTCESYMRQFASAAWVMFSYDGGATYSDTLLLHGDLGSNDESANPESYQFNITNQVGGKSNVVVKFRFDGNNPLGNNTTGDSYYFWQIDDIAFIETPANDIVLDDWIVSQGTKRGVHGTVPLAFVEPVLYTAQATNVGSLPQPNTKLEVTTNSIQGGAVTNTTSFGTLNVDSTIVINEGTGYTPADTGLYIVTMEVSSDSVDFTPNNNSVASSYSVSDSTYALDNGFISSYLGTNSFTGGEDGFQMLNVYETNAPYEVKTVWVRLSSLTNPGASVYVVAYDSTGATFGGGGQFANQTNPDYKSSEYIITNADSIRGYALIPVNFTINGGMYVGLEMYSNGGQNIVRVAIDETVPQDPEASLIYILNTGLYTNPEATLLRLGSSAGSLVPDDPCEGVNITVTGTVDDTVSTNPDGKIFNVSASGGTPPYLYSWSGPGGFTSSLQNISGLLIQGDYTATATDADGCEGSNTFSVQGNVGTDEVLARKSVSVYPNPSTGLFNLEFANFDGGFYNVSVKNVIGQVVYNASVNVNGNAVNQLDLNDLNKGIYFINVSGENYEFTEKVIVK